MSDELDDVLNKIKQIDVQLGQPRRYYQDGTEYSLKEFHAWRRDAKYAKEALLTRYRELKKEKRVDESRPYSPLLPELVERTNELLERIVNLLEQDLETT